MDDKRASGFFDTVEDFSFPVSLAFSKNNTVYITERITGRLWKAIGQDYSLLHTFTVVPIIGHHETGLLGVALDPDFDNNHYIYCYYTYGTNTSDMKNRVIRIKEGDTKEEVLLDNIPAGMIHDGGILAFGPDKNLYIGVGVQNEIKEKSQDIEWFGGKILRINSDGTIPSDNPFSNSPVYSYGHRNIFGLAFHPETGALYESEVGPDKNDEINIIDKGGNYGWPDVTGIVSKPKYIDPIIAYTPVITPTQSVFVGNDLYFGSYNEGTVHKLTLKGDNFDKVEKDEIVYQGDPWGVLGVFYSPDKSFFVTLPHKIEKFEPKVIKEAKH